MNKELALPALVTGLALLVYFVFTINIGRARGKHKIDAPQMTGPPEFERVVRVQANTLEQLITFIPCLWLFSLLISATIGAGLGGVWIVGRIVYAWGYYQAAAKRGAGFMISALATMALLFGSIVGAVMRLMSA